MRHHPSYLETIYAIQLLQQITHPNLTYILCLNFISYNNLSLLHYISLYPYFFQIEPKTYTEASKLECWKQVTQLEFNAHEKIGTWKLVDLS